MNTQNDRRYQIFVSSTFQDLKEQRKDAISVIVEQHHIPIALENFSSRSETDLKVIEGAIELSQIYVMILGYRYGECPDGIDKSYTEIEYDLAVKNGLLIIPFILEDQEIKNKRGQLNRDNERDAKELKNENKLMDFHDRVKKLFYKPWNSDSNFKFLVLQALVSEMPKCKKKGLIWEDFKPGANVMMVASGNQFIVDIVKNITKFEKLDKRCSEFIEKKEALAKFFVEKYGDYILTEKIGLFYESGSTLAFVAKHMSTFLEKNDAVNSITTNNVLVYLHHWISTNLHCSLYPISSPKDPYGATYGVIEGLVDRAPEYPSSTLPKHAYDRIKEMRKNRAELNSHKNVLMLGAISGLQLSDSYDDVYIKPMFEGKNLSDSVVKGVKKCLGPHVGSYHNKIFKRYMFDTGLPLVLFITEEKIDMEIIVGRCHFVFESTEVGEHDITWKQFCENYPLAFCVGCCGDEISKLIKKFENIGFEVITGSPFEFTALIARNKKFIEKFEA